MATSYDIQHYNGSLLVSVAEGSVNQDDSSLVLIGRNVQFYGDRQNENLVWLLENFARGTPPDNPILGQLWFDTSANTIKVYSDAAPAVGFIWRTLSPAVSTVEPTDKSKGDIWYNEVTNQMYVWNGSEYLLIGPITPKDWPATSPVAEEITDTLAGKHKVLSIYSNGVRQYIISTDPDFDTQGPLPGFVTIRRGMNANTTQTGSVFNGDATNALKLGGVLASKFLRNDQDSTTTGILRVDNVGGITIGTAQELGAYLEVGGTYENFGVLENTVLGKGWVIRGNHGGSPTNWIVIEDNGDVTISGSLTVTGGSQSTTTERIATPRNIAMTGFVSWDVTFDGSADVTAVGTTQYDPVNKAGDAMTGPLTVPLNGLSVGPENLSGPQLVTTGSKVGIFTGSPATTLDVNGSLRSGFTVSPTTSGSITLNAVQSTNHQITLTGAAQITVSNFTNVGQIVRIVLINTNNPVTWSGTPTIYWPNGATPNFTSGPNSIAIVTLFKPSASFVTATYVTY